MTMNTLPSPIGQIQLSANGCTLHGANERTFDPVAHWSRPSPERPKDPERTPLLEAPTTPISLIPDASFVPLYYLVHMASQRCLHCNTVHESSAVYAYNHVAPRMGAGRWVDHLVPVSRFCYNVDVKVVRLKQTTVPACHECARSPMNLAHLPRPADTAEYQKIVASYHRPTEKKAEGDAPTRKPATRSIDSLFDGL